MSGQPGKQRNMDNTATEYTSTFDFISDSRFRESLEADYKELRDCLACGAWKSVHVLSGSIVEAVLVDYLSATDYKKRTGKDPLKFDLADAAEACKSEGVLSDKAYDLSSVVRSYRNLIHPGRVVRLAENIDRNTAFVAKALVDIIVSEIVAARKERYGFTAEQLLRKVESDSSAMAVLPHHLKETNEFERLKLLTELIPALFSDVAKDSFEWSTLNYSLFFREVLKSLPDDKKTIVAGMFVELIRESPGAPLFEYGDAFFSAQDMQYLDARDVPLVKAHILHRLQSEGSAPWGTLGKGIGGFLEDKEVTDLVDYYIRRVVYGKTKQLREEATASLNSLWVNTPTPRDQLVMKAVNDWVEKHKDKDEYNNDVRALSALRDAWDVPF
jgi:hypothetical protein